MVHVDLCISHEKENKILEENKLLEDTGSPLKLPTVAFQRKKREKCFIIYISRNARQSDCIQILDGAAAQ